MTVECGNCGRPSTDGYTLCNTCAYNLTKALRRIPAIIADLTVTRTRLDRMGRNRVGGKSSETPLPIRLDRNGMPLEQHLLDVLDTTLVGYARILCDRHQIRPNRRLIIELVDALRSDRRPDGAALSLSPATTSEITAIWLADHQHWIRTLPNPTDVHDRITGLIDKATRTIDRMEPLVFRGPCYQCGANMAAEQDALIVECGHCRTQYDSREVRAGLIDQVHHWNLMKSAVLDLVEQIVEVRIPDATFRKWVERKRISPSRWYWDGVEYDFWYHRNATPLYCVGDAVRLAVKWSATKDDAEPEQHQRGA